MNLLKKSSKKLLVPLVIGGLIAGNVMAAETSVDLVIINKTSIE
jgi:hypothetical protein